ncbi:hypothetical protein CEG14_10425 [Bordetella genomosp. 1]|uniref:DUF7822 domain-containing protein n=1 Tax=Bordetella genomosp. 1 TaxID=1395607 RepID=A0A261SFA1_9BORD|nr:hypothetical protein [Bordetella genomosp. 1]OZI35490.1 hypothetical protein CEG14_10425 [Bordetella genomosp. 1]
MANRSYLYSLDNQPAEYADRPRSCAGLSEWPYAVPFSFRLLASADARLSASLLSDGLDDEPVPLYAINADFDAGYARVQRFVAILREHIAQETMPAAAHTAAHAAAHASLHTGGLVASLKRWFGTAAPAQAPQAARGAYDLLPGLLDETLAFLAQHRDRRVQLETIELEIMSESDPDVLRARAEAELALCVAAGQALDALPADLRDAARVLREACATRTAGPLEAFHGLRLDDDCDNTRDRSTEYPLGLYWTDVLYFEPSLREDASGATASPDAPRGSPA